MLQFLEASPAVNHLCVNEQSVRMPSGDVVSLDVAREGATSILEALEASAWSRRAPSWSRTWTSVSPSPRLEPNKKPLANRPTRWSGSSWNKARARKLGSPSPTCFMIVATMIAGIGVMLDQPILIVGAMVIGPEFGPLVALCIGIVTVAGIPPPRWALWF